MYIENFLKQFWRCVDMEYTGNDKFVCEAFHYKEKLTDKNMILSGLHFEHDIDEPGCPPFISFYVWDLRANELNPDYWQTGHVHEFKPIKNGFAVVTGNHPGDTTTYTFKKTKVNPFQKFEQKQLRNRIADIEDGTAELQEQQLIKE